MNRTVPSGAAVATAKKAAAAAARARKPKAGKKAPGANQLVASAIKALGEQGGSSLPAIKKYIVATHGVDAEKLDAVIKKQLKQAVGAKKLVATKGTFKLTDATAKKKKKSPAKKKKASPKKKPAAKKKAGPKKKVLAVKSPKARK